MTGRATTWLLGAALACLAPVGLAQETFEDGIAAYREAVDSGKEDHPSYAEAARIWGPLAEAGDPGALYHMGVLEMFGYGGVPFDKIDGFHKMQRAAEEGYPTAQAFLASQFEGGGGIYTVTSDELALEWYRKAADGGACAGIRRLSVAYANGELGLARDDGQAKAWRERLEDCRKY